MNNVYLLKMSTNSEVNEAGITATWHAAGYPPPIYYSWSQVSKGGIGITQDDTIVVVAHGDNEAIGNSDNSLTISPVQFLQLIRKNMEKNRIPKHVYIWACAKDLPLFAANVANAAESQGGWKGMTIYGTRYAVSGDVQHPGHGVWTPIYVTR